MPSSLVNVHKMTDLSLDEVKRMSELSRGVAMEVTQPSCLFFFTFVFVGYYYEEEEENVSHKTRFTPTHVMRRRLRRRRRKIHHCRHQKGSRRRMKMIDDDDDDDFLNLIRLYKKEEKNPTKSRVRYKKGKNIRNANEKTYPSRTPLKVKVSIFMFYSFIITRVCKNIVVVFFIMV